MKDNENNLALKSLLMKYERLLQHVISLEKRNFKDVIKAPENLERLETIQQIISLISLEEDKAKQVAYFDCLLSSNSNILIEIFRYISITSFQTLFLAVNIHAHFLEQANWDGIGFLHTLPFFCEQKNVSILVTIRDRLMSAYLIERSVIDLTPKIFLDRTITHFELLSVLAIIKCWITAIPEDLCLDDFLPELDQVNTHNDKGIELHIEGIRGLAEDHEIERLEIERLENE